MWQIYFWSNFYLTKRLFDFSQTKVDEGSVAGNIRAKANRTAETVDAWKNPK